MITILRKNQRVLMLVVAVLTIIAFAFLYDYNTTTGPVGPDYVAEVYGRKLSQADVDREIKSYSLALTMQQFDLIGSLGGMAENENQAVSDYVFNVLVLQREADRLGISPTDTQVADRIKSLPVFQTSGQFDPRKYAVFVQEQLGPRGFTELQLENIVRNALRLERIKTVIGAPAAVGRAEIQEAARIFQKVDLEVVRFAREGLADQAVVSEEEIAGSYTRNQASLLSNETRAIEVVEFAPAAEETALEGRAKVEAQQKLADAASVFAEKAATAFGETAAAAGRTVQKTPEFDRTGTLVPGTEAPAGPLAEDLRTLAPAAFLLTESSPVSDVLQAGDRFYVIKLIQVSPQRELTLEEVRPLITAQLKGIKTERLVRENANAVLAKVREAVAGGQSFAVAAAAAGLTVETLPALDLTAPNLTPAEQAAARISLLLEPGQLSGFVPAPDGGFAVFLASRAPLDAASASREKDEIEPGLLENKKRLLFLTWLSAARQDAKITFAPGGR